MGTVPDAQKAYTQEDYQAKKKKEEKIMMNEQNWQLAQDRPDLYIPGKLPFFKKDDEQEFDTEPKEMAKEDDQTITLKREESKFTTDNFGADQDPNSLIDTEVRDLLFGKNSEIEQDVEKKISFSEHEALLVQLPGTLPFQDIKPHSSDAMFDLINRYSD